MERYVEGEPGDRVLVKSSGPFRCFYAQKGAMALFAGPPTADTRITSFKLPEGCDGLIVEYDADEEIHTTLLNPGRVEEVDPVSLVVQLEAEAPMSIRDQVVNEIARLMREQNLLSGEPETVEEANDFEVEDEWTEEPALQMRPETLLPVVDETPEETPPTPAPDDEQAPEKVPVEEPID